MPRKERKRIGTFTPLDSRRWVVYTLTHRNARGKPMFMTLDGRFTNDFGVAFRYENLDAAREHMIMHGTSVTGDLGLISVEDARVRLLNGEEFPPIESTVVGG